MNADALLEWLRMRAEDSKSRAKRATYGIEYAHYAGKHAEDMLVIEQIHNLKHRENANETRQKPRI